MHKNLQKLFLKYTIIRALGQFGGTGPKYSTTNGPRYTESKAKSSTPYLAPNGVFRLIFIEAFLAMVLIFAICFSIWACTLMKKQKSNDQSKFVYQAIMKRLSTF